MEETMAEGKFKIGDSAPGFTLKDHNGNEVSLSEVKGKKVVLGFHPLAWTGICAKQMQALEAHKERFDNLNAVAFGISVDSSPSKHAWAKELGVEHTRLLADFWPHGKVAQTYGTFNDTGGFSERAVFVICPDGTIQFQKIYPIKELPDLEEVIAVLEKL
jgi:peroxiredoxin